MASFNGQVPVSKKIIFFELNEVPYRVLDEYCRVHPQSHIAKALPQFEQLTTITEDKGHLSPWVTWPSLHRGVNNELHGISEIGHAKRSMAQSYPPIWDILSRNKISTGIFGSLGTYPLPDNIQDYSFYVPDTFAEGAQTHPTDLQTFQELNLNLVKKSGRNVYGGLPIKEMVRFLAHIPSLGVRTSTLYQATKQVIKEQFNAKIKIRRRTFQSILAFDIFLKQLEIKKPEFATFFTNHVASSMHRYWAAKFPNDYKDNRFDSDWIKTYGGEIDYAMGVFDQFFFELKKFCDKNSDYQIWILSSMGQGPSRSQPIENELVLKDLSLFLKALDVKAKNAKILNSMFPQLNFSIDVERVEQFKSQINKLTLNGTNFHFNHYAEGCISLDLGHANLPNDQSVEFDGVSYTLSHFGLELQKTEDRSTSSAYHIPEGLFLKYVPGADATRNTVKRKSISTLDVVPMILNFFGLPVPSYIKKAM